MSCGSPAVDAGDNLATSATTDLDGNPRVANGIIDMGAYEGGAGGGGPANLSCPASVTIACTDSTDPSANANLGVATATDSCTGGSLATTFTDNANLTGCNGTGTIIRTWSTTDSVGSTTQCDQIIVITDAVAPALTAPVDTIVECDAIPAPASLTATDNCDPAPSVSFSEQSIGACLARATLTRTWTTSAACANTSTAVQIITVQDTTPPVPTAALNLLTAGDEEGGGGNDDDEGMFIVVASCADNCEGLAGCAATSLSAVLTCVNGQSITVTPGQLVEIEDEDEGGCDVEYENGKLEIEGRVTLAVTCTDASGNTASATALPLGINVDNDTETEDDD